MHPQLRVILNLGPNTNPKYPSYGRSKTNFWTSTTKADTEQFFNQVLFVKENYQVDQIPALSEDLLSKIPVNKTLAEKALHPYYVMATKISPNHYANDYFLCEFHSDPTEWFTSMKYCLDGLQKELQNPGTWLGFLTKISSQIYWTIIALVGFFVILYIAKYLPFTIQYYSSNFYWISPSAFLFIIAIVSLLILFTLGWLCFFAFTYIFLWRFPSLKEKALLLVLAGLTMCLPFTFTAPALAKQYYKSIYYDLLNADTSLQPQKYVDRIKDYVSLHPRDAYALFTLGNLEKKVGNLDSAQSYFEQSLAANADFVKTKINLANTKYELASSDEAKADYKKLISQYPSLMSPYLNISQIYTYESKYLEGEDYLNQAKKLDEAKFQEMSQTLHYRKGYVRLIYEKLAPEDLHEQIYHMGDTYKFNFQQFFLYYFPKHSIKLFYYKVIFMVVFSLIFQFFTHTRNFYVLYTTREQNLERLTLIQLKDYPKIYKQFAANLERREKIIRTLGLLLPGFWSFTIEDIVMSFTFASLYIFFLTGLILERDVQNINHHFPWTYFYLFVVAVIFLTNVISIKMGYGKKKN